MVYEGCDLEGMWVWLARGEVWREIGGVVIEGHGQEGSKWVWPAKGRVWRETCLGGMVFEW